MTRAAERNGIPDEQWRSVSERRRCPVCGASEGCHVHEEDDFASCARAPSDWPLTNGAWLHRLPADGEWGVGGASASLHEDSGVRSIGQRPSKLRGPECT